MGGALRLFIVALLFLPLIYSEMLPLHASKMTASGNSSVPPYKKAEVQLLSNQRQWGSSWNNSTLFVLIDCKPHNGVAPLTMTCTSSVSGGFPPYGYAWNLGDGYSSNQPNLNYTYRDPSPYLITLVVTDTNANQARAWTSVYVVAPLRATVIIGPTSDNAPLGLNCTAVVSGGNPPYSLLWEFGDGTNTTVERPSHVYKKAGLYNITLIVSDFVGRNVTDSLQVLTPLPSFTSPLQIHPWIIFGVVALVAVVTVGLVMRHLRKGRRERLLDRHRVEDDDRDIEGPAIPLLAQRPPRNAMISSIVLNPMEVIP